jgi:hypothetical protein
MSGKICPDGKIYNEKTRRCIKEPKVKTIRRVKEPKVKEPKVCPVGKILNLETNRCVKEPKEKTHRVKEPKVKTIQVKEPQNNKPESPPGPPIPIPVKKKCPEGKILNHKTNRCIKDPNMKKSPKSKTVKITEPPIKKCPLGQKLNISGDCVKIPSPKIEIEKSQKQKDLEMIQTYMTDSKFLTYVRLRNMKLITTLNTEQIADYIKTNKPIVEEYIKRKDSIIYDLELNSNEHRQLFKFLRNKRPEIFAEMKALPNAFSIVTYIRNHKEKWIKDADSFDELHILINLPKEEKSQVELPESVSNSVSTFLDSLNSIQMEMKPEIKDKITYSGMGIIDQQLMYLRLLKKYKNDCVLFISKGRIFSDKFDERDFNMLANDIVNCVNRGIELFIIPLSFTAKDAIAGISDGASHANMLIYRVNHKENGNTVHTIEHFEPHGFVAQTGDKENIMNLSKRIKDLVEKLQSKVKKVYEKTGFPNVEMEYISPREVCPYIKGVQAIQDVARVKTWAGFCGLWSMFFAEMIIRNPSVSSNVMYSMLLKFARNDTKYLNNIMNGYLMDLNRDLYEMFGKIFKIKDKSIILKIITNYNKIKDPNDAQFISLYKELIEKVHKYYHSEYYISRHRNNRYRYVELDEKILEIQRVEKEKRLEAIKAKEELQQKLEKDKQDLKKMKQDLKEEKMKMKEEKMKNKENKLLKKLEKIAESK